MLDGHAVTIWNDHGGDTVTLAGRLKDIDIFDQIITDVAGNPTNVVNPDVLVRTQTA